MWYEIAIISTMVVIGSILFGHFEEMTPKWERLLKFAAYTTLLCLISYYFGRKWFHIALGIALLFPVIVHVWWLPKNGINGWTGEPKEKYYQLRGWSKKGSGKEKDQF
jgi:hypothetical protein